MSLRDELKFNSSLRDELQRLPPHILEKIAKKSRQHYELLRRVAPIFDIYLAKNPQKEKGFYRNFYEPKFSWRSEIVTSRHDGWRTNMWLVVKLPEF